MYMDSVYPGKGIISRRIGQCLKSGIGMILLINGNVREQEGLREYRGIGIR